MCIRDSSGYNEVRSVFDVEGKDTMVRLTFRNNSAVLGGNQIYGGWLGWTVDENDITR